MSFEMTETAVITYDLPGTRLLDVATLVAQAQETGTTTWTPRYTYTTTGAGIDDAAVTVGTRITVPRWTGYAGAIEAEQREWDRFSEALLAHERGHVALVTEHLCNIDQRMIGESEQTARAIWQDALDSLRAASDAYDLETDHGRNTGTIIDLDVVSRVAG